MKHTQKTKPPISPKQLAAKRANAARSTGPRAPQGKSNSARNARQDGFTATTFAVVRLEDIQEVATLRADILADYRPANPQEVFALDRMAVAQQTILRDEGFHRLTRQSNSGSLVLRYQARAERLYRRAVEEFTRIRALRDKLQNEAILNPEPEEATAT